MVVLYFGVEGLAVGCLLIFKLLADMTVSTMHSRRKRALRCKHHSLVFLAMPLGNP